ncbi:Abi family protein, partial [Collinsella aerofaciens]
MRQLWRLRPGGRRRASHTSAGGPRDGQYAGLDFGHLVDLAAIDRELRGFLLPLTLDVENSAKTRLIERITEKPGEDGYSILSDYLAALNHGDR